MFKHIKKYNLFESSKIDDENLLIVKDCFQDIVDEFDLEWVDSIDWFHLMNGSYNIRKIEGNSDWSILIDIILPTKMRCKENINNRIERGLDPKRIRKMFLVEIHFSIK